MVHVIMLLEFSLKVTLKTFSDFKNSAQNNQTVMFVNFILLHSFNYVVFCSGVYFILTSNHIRSYLCIIHKYVIVTISANNN